MFRSYSQDRDLARLGAAQPPEALGAGAPGSPVHACLVRVSGALGRCRLGTGPGGCCAVVCRDAVCDQRQIARQVAAQLLRAQGLSVPGSAVRPCPVPRTQAGACRARFTLQLLLRCSAAALHVRGTPTPIKRSRSVLPAPAPHRGSGCALVGWTMQPPGGLGSSKPCRVVCCGLALCRWRCPRHGSPGCRVGQCAAALSLVLQLGACASKPFSDQGRCLPMYGSPGAAACTSLIAPAGWWRPAAAQQPTPACWAQVDCCAAARCHRPARAVGLEHAAGPGEWHADGPLLLPPDRLCMLRTGRLRQA